MTKIRVGSEYTPPENAYVGDGGVFPVTLIEIGEERESDGQFGLRMVQEWQFAIDDPTSPFDGQLLWDSWVTAPKNGQVHPKSNYYGYMTALFKGRAAPEGTEIDIETTLIGRQALATVERSDNGSMRITNLGAMLIEIEAYMLDLFYGITLDIAKLGNSRRICDVDIFALIELLVRH